LAFGVYPKQMTWASAVATTTLPLATAWADVAGEPAFVFPDVLAAGEIEPVDAAVVGADEYAAAEVLQIDQPKVSALARGRFAGSPRRMRDGTPGNYGSRENVASASCRF